MTVNDICYACGREPEPNNWSVEHIVPNALGGRWKSSRLLCRPCNSAFGDVIDAALCREFGAPMNMLGLSRERGPVPNQVVRLGSGEEYLRDAAGNRRLRQPVVREHQSEHEVTIDLQGSVPQVRQALRGLARKYPGKIDVEQWMSRFTNDRRFHSGPTQFEVRGAGSEEAFRAIAKIAASAYIAGGGSRDQILSCLRYIKGESPAQHARWFYAVDVMADRPTDEVTNVVGVSGEPGAPLWAYVELFRVYRFAVRLAEHYSGPAIRLDRVYDLIVGTTIEGRCLRLDFGDLDVEHGGVDVDAVIEQWKVLIGLAQRRSRQAAIGAAVEQAFKHAMAANSEATVEDLMPHLTSALEPILLAMIRRPDKSKDGDK
jgi:hypothetical protein